jgi:pilus assembly protein Flp/PilA
MIKLIKNLRKDKQGATAIEYGLIAAVIAVAAIVAMSAVGTSLSSMFTTVSENLDPDKP